MQESEYPLVSICMPVYNGARFLSYTIDNILAQSYRNIELIIVDDGSIDNSYNIAKQYVNKSKWGGGKSVFSMKRRGFFGKKQSVKRIYRRIYNVYGL